MVDKKAAVGVLGVGAGIGLLLLLTRKAKAAAPPSEPGQVVVGLLNPPSEATMWSLTLIDWDITTPIYYVGWERLVSESKRLALDEAAIFEIPSGLNFPLRVLYLQLTKWNEDRTALIQLYFAQSFRPYLWDFDEMVWSDEPDPTYREAFIPDYGGYHYNVSEERFE